MTRLGIILIVIVSCSSYQTSYVGDSDDFIYDDNTAGSTDSNAGISSDTAVDTDSLIDTEPRESDSDNNSDAYDYELIQDLSNVTDYISEMVVNNGMIFFTFPGAFVLCRTDVNGEQEYECMKEAAFWLTVFDDLVWWFSLKDAVKYNVKTNIIEYFPLGEYSRFSLNFTVDKDGMFFADHGCKNAIGMNHDGEIIFHETQDYPGYPSFFPYVTSGPSWVYCSGSAGAAFSAGKIFGVPKTGGDIIEITSAPVTIENNDFHSTGSMKVVDDTLYYFHFYAGGSKVDPVWLVKVPVDGGESTVVFDAKEYAGYESPLVYDERRHAFYFTIRYSKRIYKYEIDSKMTNILQLEHEPRGQVAVDDTYVYWYMNNGIYKTNKF